MRERRDRTGARREARCRGGGQEARRAGADSPVPRPRAEDASERGRGLRRSPLEARRAARASAPRRERARARGDANRRFAAGFRLPARPGAAAGRAREPATRRPVGRAGRRRRGLSLAPGRRDPRRAARAGDDRGEEPGRRGRAARARGAAGARRPARARPPRRDPDPRPDDRGRPARGTRDPAAAAGSDQVVRVAVAATAPFGADVLERLAARHEIAYLLTRPDRPRGRGRRLGAPPAKETAERLGIEVRQPESVADFDPEEETIVLAAYGALIPEPVLERALWLNVHPSLLPRWRGAAPIERALMAGDRETGVTIIKLVPELDAGPIAAQRAFPVDEDDDYGSVSARAAEVGAELLEPVLSDPSFTPQPEEGVTYAEKIGPEDRALDWSR